MILKPNRGKDISSWRERERIVQDVKKNIKKVINTFIYSCFYLFIY